MDGVDKLKMRMDILYIVKNLNIRFNEFPDEHLWMLEINKKNNENFVGRTY